MASLGGDRELILAFIALFSRFEYSLKRTPAFRKADKAEPNWDTFADSLRDRFSQIDRDRFQAAVKFLTSSPPQTQIVDRGDIGWKDSPPGDGEHHEKYVLRLVRIVRNNLFHGGKYPAPFGPMPDPVRNRELIQACVEILQSCLALDDHVRSAFEEAA